MRLHRTSLILAAAAATCIVFCGGAAAQGAGSGPATSAERHVMDQASRANIAEIEEGRLALTHSGNPDVQALGNRLIQDHSKAEDTLEALAATLGAQLPAKPSAKQQRQIAALGGLRGSAFDRLFAASEVAAHRKAITRMDRAASTVKNPALQAWIKESIPVLEEHRQLAQNLPSQVAITRAAQVAAATPAGATSPRALAQPSARSTPRTAAGGAPIAASADAGLLRLSAQGNLAEVELGRLAITRSKSAAVRSLGTRLAQDGSKGMANLQTVAAMLRVQLPTAPNAAQEGQLARLRRLHGATFDQRFERVAHQDEGKMLRQFQSGVGLAQNGAVKSTIQDMIPIVKEHLRIAQAARAAAPAA